MKLLPSRTHSTLRAFCALCIAACLASLAPATEAGEEAENPAPDSEQPISIRADSAKMDGAKGISVYQGAVRIEQGSMRIFAEEVEVLVEEDLVERIVARGGDESVRYERHTGEAQITAQANHLTYQVREEQLDLRGDARLAQADERLTGEHITYDMRADTWQVIGEQDEPVSIIFRPGSDREPR